MSALIFSIGVVFICWIILLSVAPVMLIVERRGSAWMQRRVGPNRVGPLGLLQPVADAVKLIFKEDLIPTGANKPLFSLAPALGVFPPFLALAGIPLAGSIHWQGQEYLVGVLNINVGLLFVLAVTSLHVFSVLTAGWASNNKFSLMGALRASSQMISYEIAMGVSVAAVVLAYGSLDLREIIKLQEHGSAFTPWSMSLLVVPFVTMWICAFAETNRLPFDLPEGESELVAGYHSEYSGLRWALFFLGEYDAMFVASALLTTLFCGGFNVPFLSEAQLREFFAGAGLDLTAASIATVLSQLASFSVKVGIFMWVFVWVRWTLPRFRYDQLMNLGWKMLLPIGIANVVYSLVVSFFQTHGVIQ